MYTEKKKGGLECQPTLSVCILYPSVTQNFKGHLTVDTFNVNRKIFI